MNRSWRLALAVACLAANPLLAQRGGHYAGRPAGGSRLGIGVYGGLGYAGWGYGNYGFGGNFSRFGYGGGFGLGVPLGTWSGSPSYFAPRPLAPSAAPAWIDRSQPMVAVPAEMPSGTAIPEEPSLAPAAAPVAAAAGDVSRTVLVKIAVPAADAQVWFGAALMPGQGTERAFRSPELAAGQTYLYTLKAKWTAAGEAKEALKQVTVRAGDNVTVTFADEAIAIPAERLPPPIPQAAAPLVPPAAPETSAFKRAAPRLPVPAKPPADGLVVIPSE